LSTEKLSDISIYETAQLYKCT